MSGKIETVIPFGQVIDLLLDAVVIVEPDGRYVYVSAAFERIFGYAPEEVVGKQMLHLVHPDDREKTMAAVKEIMAGQEKLTLENRYIRKDGEVVHIMWSARWVPEHGVRVAVARDVSARVRAEATQAAVYAISEAAHAAESLQSLYRTIHHVLGGPHQRFRGGKPQSNTDSRKRFRDGCHGREIYRINCYTEPRPQRGLFRSRERLR